MSNKRGANSADFVRVVTSRVRRGASPATEKPRRVIRAGLFLGRVARLLGPMTSRATEDCVGRQGPADHHHQLVGIK